MRRALALTIACAAGSGAAAEPLPAAPILPAPRAAPAPRTIVEGTAGIATNFDGAQGGALGVRLLRRAWSVELAIAGVTPETRDGARVTRGGLAIAGCRHLALLALCPVLAGGLAHAASGTDPLLAVGARLAVELQVTRRIAVRTRFEGHLFVTSSALTPRGEMWLGVDALVRIR